MFYNCLAKIKNIPEVLAMNVDTVSIVFLLCFYCVGQLIILGQIPFVRLKILPLFLIVCLKIKTE